MAFTAKFVCDECGNEWDTCCVPNENLCDVCNNVGCDCCFEVVDCAKCAAVCCEDCLDDDRICKNCRLSELDTDTQE